MKITELTRRDIIDAMAVEKVDCVWKKIATPIIALINEDCLHSQAGRFLHVLRRLGHLIPILNVRGRHMQRQQMPQGIDRQWTFEHLRRFAPSYPARAPLSGVDCSVRPSRIAALGDGSFPLANRKTVRKRPVKAS